MLFFIFLFESDKIKIMKNELQSKKSNELNLNFSFEIFDYSFREMKIKIGTPHKKINFDENYFSQFILELISFLTQNNYNKRWDYEKVYLFELENLNLSEKDLKHFKNEMKLISNFDLLEGK